MHARTHLRLILMVLAGMVALPLVVGTLVLRGPAAVSRAADGDPFVIATVAVGTNPQGVAVNPTPTASTWPTMVATTSRSSMASATPSWPPYRSGTAPMAWPLTPTPTASTWPTWQRQRLGHRRCQQHRRRNRRRGDCPCGVAVNPNTNRIYVANTTATTSLSSTGPATPWWPPYPWDLPLGRGSQPHHQPHLHDQLG